MSVIVFRVIPDVEETVFRDIHIDSEANLMQLHEAILQAFGFDKEQIAAFYESDADWKQIREIPQISMDEKDPNSMDSVHIHQVVSAVEDRLIYIYDFLNLWTFYLEVLEIDAAASLDAPSIGRSYGEAPKQNSKAVQSTDAEAILLEALLEGMEEEDDLFKDDDFESLDDYEELL